MKPKATLSVQVPGELAKRLEDTASQRLTSVSAVVREILVDHLREQGVAANKVNTGATQPEPVVMAGA